MRTSSSSEKFRRNYTQLYVGTSRANTQRNSMNSDKRQGGRDECCYRLHLNKASVDFDCEEACTRKMYERIKRNLQTPRLCHSNLVLQQVFGGFPLTEFQ